MDKLVESGINLHKAIAMGMAEGGGQAGKDDGSFDRSPAPKGEQNPNVKNDMGMSETMPGMKMTTPDKY